MYSSANQKPGIKRENRFSFFCYGRHLIKAKTTQTVCFISGLHKQSWNCEHMVGLLGYPDTCAFCSNIVYVLAKEICFIFRKHEVQGKLFVYVTWILALFLYTQRSTTPNRRAIRSELGYPSPCEYCRSLQKHIAGLSLSLIIFLINWVLIKCWSNLRPNWGVRDCVQSLMSKKCKPLIFLCRLSEHDFVRVLPLGQNTIQYWHTL